jgi:exopolyphosphatase/guanosine-5'-triphosphate,3'-diphosphate pyrophosphatase
VLGLSGYESDKVHGSVMPRAEVDAWTKRLLSMPSSAIAALGPVQRGREDVIGPGSLILSLVMQTLGAADVLVSERDILDGLVR